ncbi:2-iminoacetate synthase ThiH [Inconstantimicrobium mannanitabidum]|uniref:Thiamine biosynthesis protein ThiH n=1 Tax=Inconstantimicrobium mannanitabidum TaxID=1604901 RepID=A0ACB5RI61_9CLOT|nr:2-iminoacetate synthase ThiH [Clostridium sp. TW13]GKX68777.1 thiamine biosynthesis protein ThiH [Clostridium sp. TW13]
MFGHTYLEDSAYEYLKKYDTFNFEEFWNNVTKEDVLRVINKRKHTDEDFLILISEKAEECLEEMAQKAHALTMQHFGKAVMLYTPMYIANYCINRCAYCGYNHDNIIARKQLTMEEIAEEAKAISSEGFKQILFLTGESPKDTPVSYIVEATKTLKKYFPSIAIEIYPMDEEDYRKVVKEGVDSLSVYQEVYDEEIYNKVHLGGPKKDFRYRLETPERAIKAGVRTVNIGALLGLNNWRIEMFKEIMHGYYLRKNFPAADVGFSFSRIRPCVGGFDHIQEVTDKNIVQAIVAARIMFPNSVLNISTREAEGFRDRLIPLGINKISAGVSTAVGGHTKDKENTGESQFDTNDKRTTVQMKEMIKGLGYQPIFKDWESFVD